MGRGGISRRIIDVMLAVFGRARGSLGLTTIGTCEFFGAMSGSSPATVAAVGRLLYPALREHGYGEKFAVGLVTSSGAIASVIPPSLVMILYGASAEQSVAALFLGGVIPGLFIGVVVACMSMFMHSATISVRVRRLACARSSTALRKGAWALGTPSSFWAVFTLEFSHRRRRQVWPAYTPLS